MIAHLTGTILHTGVTHLVLDVGGVGYLIAVRIPRDYAVGATASFHTYLAVRENALDLYGFGTLDEREMFELLLTIPKIGPKSAMQIMTQADLPLIKSAILKQDASYLTKMSGIGKKTAEKIVAELKDAFEYTAEESFRENASGEDADLVDALLALGYTQKDARDALLKISSDAKTTSARLKEALKMLGS
jgi:holliday junction DNA helicase RuvA